MLKETFNIVQHIFYLYIMYFCNKLCVLLDGFSLHSLKAIFTKKRFTKFNSFLIF